MISGTERDLTKEEWDAERFGHVCGNAEAYANLRTVVESLCSQSRRCSWEVREQLQMFFNQIDDRQTKALDLLQQRMR